MHFKIKVEHLEFRHCFKNQLKHNTDLKILHQKLKRIKHTLCIMAFVKNQQNQMWKIIVLTFYYKNIFMFSDIKCMVSLNILNIVEFYHVLRSTLEGYLPPRISAHKTCNFIFLSIINHLNTKQSKPYWFTIW